MAGNSGSLKFEITVDNSGAISGIKKIGDEANDAGEKGKKSFSAFSTLLDAVGVKGDSFTASMLKVGGAYVGVQKLEEALRFMKDQVMGSIKSASDLQEVASAFSVVFGGQLIVAETWAKTLVDGYAMSTREAKQYLTTLQSMLVPMGMNSTAAGKMSFVITKLAADLGSMKNLPTADVMRDITASLVGQYETTRKYGASLSAASVEQKAMNMGLAENKDALTAADKAQAAFKLIVESSAVSTGDMARTAHSYANELKKSKANVEDLQAVMGEALLPVASQVLRAFNDWAKSSLQNKQALVDMTAGGVMVFLRASQALLAATMTVHDIWLGLKIVVPAVSAIISASFEAAFEGLRAVVPALDDIMKGMVAIGAIKSNPFDSIRDGLRSWTSFSHEAAEKAIDDATRIRAGYSRINDGINTTIAGLSNLKASTIDTANNGVAITGAASDKTVKLTEAQIAKQQKALEDLTTFEAKQYDAEMALRTKRQAEIAKQLKEQIDAAERAAKEKTSAEEKMYNDLKFDAVGYRVFKEKQLLEEYDRLVKTTGDSVNAYAWYTKQIEALDKEEINEHEKGAREQAERDRKDLEDLRMAKERATNDALRLLGDESATAVSIRAAQNAQILANAQVTDAERLRLAGLLADNEAEIMRRAAEDERLHNIQRLENSKSMYDMAKGYAQEYLTVTHADTQKLTEAWIRGEDLKTAASEMAKNKLIGFASNLASGYFDKMAEGVLIEVKNYLGLGAAQSSTLGATWQEKLGSVAGYLAGMGVAMAGARAVSGYAAGGWLQANPNGGMINQGSGFKDDVFLGLTHNGKTANYGMKREFVVNQESTANNLPLLYFLNTNKHIDLLAALNTKNYEGGGPISDPREIANKVNGSGFGTFVQEWNDTGDWEEAVVKAVLYYAGALGGAATGHMMGKDYLGFAGGGPITNVRGFGFGDFLGDLIDDLGPLGSTMPGTGIPTASEIWDNPMLLLDNNVTGAAGEFQSSLGISGMDGSLNSLAAAFWGLDFWGAMAQVRDSVDAHLIPFYTDVLTPGRSIDFSRHPEEQIKGIFDSILSHPEGLLGMAGGGQLPAYANGTPYVPRTGLALVHQGEEITPAWANSERRDAADAVNELREEIAPLLFVCASNSQKMARFIDTWDTNGLPETRV